jgi:hypothetical protein
MATFFRGRATVVDGDVVDDEEMRTP